MMWKRKNEEEEEEVPLPSFEAPQLPDPTQIQLLYYPHIPEGTPKEYELLARNSKLFAFANLNDKDFKFLYSLVKLMVNLSDIHTLLEKRGTVSGTETPAYDGYLAILSSYVNLTRGRMHEEMRLMRTVITRVEGGKQWRW